MRAFRLGITGKIASGKSTLAALLRERGIEVLDTDQIAKDLMSSDPELRSALIEILSDKAFENGVLNTKFVAAKLFSDVDARLSVEAAVHPVVMGVVEGKLAAAAAGSIVGVESAILVQTGYDREFDLLVLVKCSDELIIERNRLAGKFSEDDLKTRLAEQDYSDELEEFADLIVENNSTRDEFASRCTKIIDLIRVMAAGELPEEPLRSNEDE